MVWNRPWPVAVLAVALIACGPIPAQADTFTVTTRDLKSLPFPPNTTIQLRVFKQIEAANGAVRAGSSFDLGEELITQEQTTAANAYATFSFTVDVNDPRLTGGQANPDRTILLLFTRNGGNTAIVPFIVVGEVNNQQVVVNVADSHRLNISVPEPLPTGEPCFHAECYPLCCPANCSLGGRRKLSRH